jgi:hypothetical protein
MMETRGLEVLYIQEKWWIWYCLVVDEIACRSVRMIVKQRRLWRRIRGDEFGFACLWEEFHRNPSSFRCVYRDESTEVKGIDRLEWFILCGGTMVKVDFWMARTSTSWRLNSPSKMSRSLSEFWVGLGNLCLCQVKRCTQIMRSQYNTDGTRGCIRCPLILKLNLWWTCRESKADEKKSTRNILSMSMKWL